MATPELLPIEMRNANSAQVGVVSKALGQNYVSYHPLLVTVTGNVKSALFLSHALAWSRHIYKTRPDREGWFWMRGTEWQDGTGLSVREQSTARQKLVQLGVLEEKRVGVPAKMWFRIDLDRLGRLVAAETGQTFEQWNWDRKAMLKLLGQPIPCHRILIRVADSVVGGLILSYLFSAVRRDLVGGGAGEWIHIPVAHTRDTIGITAKQQRLARERLRHAGLIEETFEQRVQPRLLTRLNTRLLALECAKKTNEIHCLQDSRNLVCGILQTRVAQSAKLELPKAQIKGGPMRETGVAQSANPGSRKGQLPIKKEYIQRQLQPTPVSQPATPRQAAGSGSDGDLDRKAAADVILPAKLHPGEGELVREWLSALPYAMRQLVADEWAGLIDLANRGIRPMHNRLGVLQALVRRASGIDSKPFVPTLAFGVAAARKRRAEIETARNSGSGELQMGATDAGTEAGRAMLRQKMAQLWSAGGST